jgi:hypothetical protein
MALRGFRRKCNKAIPLDTSRAAHKFHRPLISGLRRSFFLDHYGHPVMEHVVNQSKILK